MKFLKIGHGDGQKRHIVRKAREMGLEVVETSHWQMGESAVIPCNRFKAEEWVKVNKLVAWAVVGVLSGEIPRFFSEGAGAVDFDEVNQLLINFEWTDTVTTVSDPLVGGEVIL